MCQYSCVDGFATDWHLVHLGSRAVGGAGLVMQEATAVSPEGRISYGDAGIWRDEHVEKLQQMVAFINSQGAMAGIQLAHAGRKASCDLPWNGGKQLKDGINSWQTVAPSAIGFLDSDNEPHELSPDEIGSLVYDFKTAAKRACHAGYQVLEIHAAHGYLIHQFLSPLSNTRTDEYGGSFDNRIRVLLEIVEAVKTVWPENMPLFVRISATDYAEGGWDIEQSVRLAEILKANGVDLIDTSSGGLVSYAKIKPAPNYQTGFAERIRKETGILTGAVGLITDALQAETILQNKQADLILIAREALRDPYFPLHAAKELGVDIQWPLQYERAK